MFQNTILTAALAVAGFAGVSAAPVEAHAPPAPRFVRHHHHFEVLIRHRNHWDSKGIYHSRHEAERVARRLQFRGFEVMIRCD